MRSKEERIIEQAEELSEALSAELVELEDLRRRMMRVYQGLGWSVTDAELAVAGIFHGFLIQEGIRRGRSREELLQITSIAYDMMVGGSTRVN